jgi:pre-mRNA processing factor 4 (PRP4) like
MSISTSLLGNDAIAAAIKSGNINIAGAMQFEVMELSNESKDAQIQHAEILRKYESQKRGRTIVVPTAIDDVKSKLRELGKPVTLFGEGHADRRERLREVIANLEIKEEEISKIQVNYKCNFEVIPQIPFNQLESVVIISVRIPRLESAGSYQSKLYAYSFKC